MLTLLGLLLGLGQPAFAQYTKSAGKNKPTMSGERWVRDARSGKMQIEAYEMPVAVDSHGNAQGNDNDLAIDGAFSGQTVAVIHLYTGSNFDFSLPKAALAQKGFSVYRWVGMPPSPAELEAALAKSSQLWIISDSTQRLNAEHVRVIKTFFEAGHGVYIWGDNEPYYADANFVAEALFGTKMLGNLQGEQIVTLQKSPQTAGLLPNHLLTTGLEHIYEGHTISTIQPSSMLEPLIYGSASNLVTAFHDRDGRRAILDGGFTRLYMKWDTAGTARYVKNAASWLVNAERFGDAVVNPAVRQAAVTLPIPQIAITEPLAATIPAPAPVTTTRFASNLIGLLLALATLVLLVVSQIPAPGERRNA